MRAWRRALIRVCASRSTRARSSGVCTGGGGGACDGDGGVVCCGAAACAVARWQTRKHCETTKREKNRRRALRSRRLPRPTNFEASTTRLPLATLKKQKFG